MAKQRYIDTRFWIDNYVSELDPIEKLLFLYFLTNSFTDISGVYEIPLKQIALDTGIDKEMVIKILARFKSDGKIFYEEGWIGIKNFQKHQNTGNPKIAKGIEVGLSKAPACLIDRLSIGNEDLSYFNLNYNPNINSNINNNKKKIPSKTKKEPTPSQLNEDFFKGGNELVRVSELFEDKVPKELLKQELENFILYWTEPNKSGTKVKWQTENTFDVTRRFRNWMLNHQKFNKTGNNKPDRKIV